MAGNWQSLDDARVVSKAEDRSYFEARFPATVLVAGAIRQGSLERRDTGTMFLEPQHTAMDEQEVMPSRGRFCMVQPSGITLNSKWISIGRVVANEVVINDYTVSKNHARISQDVETGWLLEDLGSTNKTFVDGEPIRPHVSTVVGSWMVLRFGRMSFTLLQPSAFYQFLKDGP